MRRSSEESTEAVCRWNTFEELRDVALRAGCPEEAFDRIVKETGRDLFALATRLQSDVLNWTARVPA